ncbi:MAG: hypothetical protein Unbinned176contig1000_4 [Prokaryotic dsDNA virus sp.]|nr:MAG: hypothetical protein Unbinned176contig1000_4 [Prokaryotic dsDNA virus sp.]|tara:strand:+ start:1341 stop:2231 length:891 start_codon:yes stop_codon:yes gene_type:complete
MRNRKNFKLKPHDIKRNGIVTFTDGTNIDLPANQKTCEAYGYKYINGICCAYVPSAQIRENANDETFLNNGSGNEINKSKGTLITGNSHFIDNAFGCFVAGQNNVISPDDPVYGGLQPNDAEAYVNNASIIGGSYGKATASGQVVIGGGKGDSSDSHGHHQLSIYTLGLQNVGRTGSVMVLQGDSDRAEEIYLPLGSMNVFEINLTGICTGGTSGTVGHYKSLVQTGTCLVSSSAETENVYDAGTTTTTSSNGTTGTVTVGLSDNRFRIEITGVNNVNCSWFAVVKIFTNKISVTF